MSEAAAFDDPSARIRPLVAAGDIDAVVEQLDRLEPLAAAHLSDELQRAFYWEEKDVAAVVAVSHAGIRHGLSAAARTADAAAAASLLGKVKALAYNLGSFTWPGWDEKDVALTKADIAAGFEASRLNLQLADQLKRPSKALANALWLLGAHHLAAGDHASAADAFVLGQSHAADGDEPLVGRMLEGYTRLANVLDTPGDADLQEMFDVALERLLKEGSPGATEYANQLKTAAAVFRLCK